MRRISLTCFGLFTLLGCAHTEPTPSASLDQVKAVVPFGDKVPNAEGLDANGDGLVSDQDALWFKALVDALGDVTGDDKLHYAGLKDAEAVWLKVGFGGKSPVVEGLSALTPAQKYGLRIDAAYAQSAVESLKSEIRNLKVPLAGLALRGRFVANRDVVEMGSLCRDLADFLPAAAGDLLSESRKVAVFDLDDTVWAGHIMDLGILAVAHGGLWSSSALDETADDISFSSFHEF